VAANGDQALKMMAECLSPIHLLLTDVVMPGMNGKALAEQLIQTRPTLKVLYMSGYTDDAIVHRGVLDVGMHLINKPMSASDLTRKIHEVLVS
jgi:two-component system, cell cycle sensor histidine kinase and response regulator CckA